MSGQHDSKGLPFYPLPLWGEPMYCICDHSTAEASDMCEKCPHLPEHREAAGAELAARYAALDESGAD